LEYIERPIKLSNPKVEERAMRVMAQEDVDEFYHFEPRNQFQRRIHAATIMMLDVGLRASE